MLSAYNLREEKAAYRCSFELATLQGNAYRTMSTMFVNDVLRTIQGCVLVRSRSSVAHAGTGASDSQMQRRSGASAAGLTVFYEYLPQSFHNAQDVAILMQHPLKNSSIM